VNVVVRPAAAAELAEAHLWYESQQQGLGDAFVDAVAEVLETISEHPRRYRVVHRDVRRANLRRFPYGVHYRIVESAVVVIACFHGSRDPGRWRRRG
jgi:plasmid stabilization system protein ParE